jgi:hypothetical protein
MGLAFRVRDNSIGIDASWSYSGFMAFRTKLARTAGIELKTMRGYGGLNEWPSDEPIVGLLQHSDCDGYLTTKQCRLIAPRLRELVQTWEDTDWDKSRALSLADSMEEIARRRMRLIFC